MPRPQSLPFEEDPAISRGKRAWLLIVAALSMCGVGAMGYALKYQDADEVFGAFVIVLFLAAAVLSGYPGLYPKEVERKFTGFARLSARLATIILLLATALGIAGWQAGPYI